MSVSSDRRGDYEGAPLSRADLADDPLEQLARWLAEHERTVPAGIDPGAMALATADAAGRPSVRMVLLKGVLDGALVFYSGYGSRKGEELAANPCAALLFWWPHLHRQVRVEGPVARLDARASDAYFARRPRGSQLAAAASDQSRVVADRAALEARVAALDAAHPDAVPRPPDWGGYTLRGERFEWWQGRPDRLHDRLVHRRPAPGEGGRANPSGWVVERLGP